MFLSSVSWSPSATSAEPKMRLALLHTQVHNCQVVSWFHKMKSMQTQTPPRVEVCLMCWNSSNKIKSFKQQNKSPRQLRCRGLFAKINLLHTKYSSDIVNCTHNHLTSHSISQRKSQRKSNQSSNYSIEHHIDSPIHSPIHSPDKNPANEKNSSFWHFIPLPWHA